MADTDKKFRLAFVNAAEDIPRLIRAYGKCSHGEFALVLRPTLEKGVLVRVTAAGATIWRGGLGYLDGRPRSKAVVEANPDGSLRLVGIGGPDAGKSWRPAQKGPLTVGSEVVVAFVVGEPTAEVVVDLGRADAPGEPLTPISPKDAVAAIKAHQKLPPKVGPITLRGEWTGWMRCDGGRIQVEISRKLATYGVLTITSSPSGWRWTIQRTEKWFSRPGSDSGEQVTLVRAIEVGLAKAMGLLGEACSVRDSRRRAALDEGFAVAHPVREAREGRDPTEGLGEKVPKAGRSTAAAGVADVTQAAGASTRAKTTSAKRTRAVVAETNTPSGTARAAAKPARGPSAAKIVPQAEVVPTSLAAEQGPTPSMTSSGPARAKKATPTEVAASTAGQAEEKPTRGRKKKVEPEIDEAKDKALVDAFSAAIATALKET